MKKKRRHLLSVAVACAFLVMALASFGPDTSTYLEVIVSGCDYAPPVTVHPRVFIAVLDDNDNPVTGTTVKAFITYQRIISIDECRAVPVYENITDVTDVDGTVEFQLAEMNQNSTGDLYRVEVTIPETQENTGARAARYIGYGVESVDFLIILKDKSIL